ncbi:glucokinase [Oricola cellulosilytica]|uniref:Glucokinase n=1 Tax=Oricola cellulosilytica TaxID=1429082 RepID=A0A4R0P4T6_9HYPH|nr:glucokinase [Oricola cellulosilytica]TCD11883.1 hypothetical protein E0D97_16250 [Oricola cellulosilytica]
MQTAKRKALIGDIGGTHARFAISDIDELSVEHFAVFETKMFDSLQDAVRHYLASVPTRPPTAGFAIAGSVSGETIRLSRAPWTFARSDIADVCGTPHIHFLNDFEALALALPYLKKHDLHEIAGGDRDERGVRLVLGPGSGFGCATLSPAGRGWKSIPGFLGDASFGATDEWELAIRDEVAAAYDDAPLHEVLSGRGLETIYRVRNRLTGRGGEAIPAIEIIKAAEEEDESAVETLDCFISIFARYAGDVALTVGASGGIYLAGGIVPKILPALAKPGFLKRLHGSGGRSNYLTDLPVHAILSYDVGLRGVALALSDRFPMHSLSV